MLRKAKEIFKTVLIGILFISVILLSVFYFYRSEFMFAEKGSDTPSQSPTITDDIVRADFSGLILPETVAVKQSGKHMHAITQGDGYMRLIYRLACKNISVALGSLCVAAETDAGQWEEACFEDDLMLIKYHSPLSHSVIYADAVSSMQEEITGVDFDMPGAVDQIFIFPQKTNIGDIFALTRLSNGTIYKHTVSKTIDRSPIAYTKDFDIYINASAMTVADLYANIGKNSAVLGSTVLHSYGLNTQKLELSAGYPDIGNNSGLCNSIASYFDINPDKNGSYYDDKTASTVYVSTHGTLSIGESGIKYEQTEDSGGIPLSKYSSAFANTKLKTVQSIILSQVFISGLGELDSGLLGGDAHTVLKGAYSDGDSVTLEFIYCYSNIEIEGSGLACRIVLKDGGISAFESYSCIYKPSDSGETRKSLPPDWIINMSLPDGIEGRYTLKYRYLLSDMFAEWSAVRIK